jgi:hypothetical protein
MSDLDTAAQDARMNRFVDSLISAFSILETRELREWQLMSSVFANLAKPIQQVLDTADG